MRLALRRPLITALIAVLVFAGTMASATLLKTNFLESFADKTTLQVTQELPVGTRLSATSEAAKQVEAILDADPGVKEYLTTVGQGGSNQASMFVSLTSEDVYATTLPNLESAFAELTGAGEVKIGSINTGTSSDLSYTVTGQDEASLRTAADLVENALSTTPGLVDVSSDLSDRRPLLAVTVDKRKAAALGFTQAEIGQVIANTLNGTKAGTIILEGESRDIKVRPQNADESTPEQIAALELPVSQLQQQQAVDRATDRLEKKSDRLKARGDRLKEDGDALARPPGSSGRSAEGRRRGAAAGRPGRGRRSAGRSAGGPGRGRRLLGEGSQGAKRGAGPESRTAANPAHRTGGRARRRGAWRSTRLISSAGSWPLMPMLAISN